MEKRKEKIREKEVRGKRKKVGRREKKKKKGKKEG